MAHPPNVIGREFLPALDMFPGEFDRQKLFVPRIVVFEFESCGRFALLYVGVSIEVYFDVRYLMEESAWRGNQLPVGRADVLRARVYLRPVSNSWESLSQGRLQTVSQANIE